MEANSQFILATEFISTDLDELSQIDVKRIFKNALSHNQQLPEKLLISDEVKEEQLVSDIKKRNIELISTSEEALAIFINEARNGFQQHVNTGMGQWNLTRTKTYAFGSDAVNRARLVGVMFKND